MCICGNPKCRGLCNISLGHKVYEFYNQFKNSLRDSSIGTAKKDELDHNRFMYIKGYEFYNPSDCKKSDDYCTLYGLKSSTIVSKPVFQVDPSDLAKYISEYSTFAGLDKDEYNKFRADMLAVARRSKLIVPINFTDEFDVNVYRDNTTKVKNKLRCTIDRVRWAVNPESKLVECTLRFRVDSKTLKDVNITKYGVDFFNRQTILGSADLVQSAIRMNQYGYIEPLLVSTQSAKLAIDNCSIYYGKAFYDMREVGYWDGNTLNITDGNIDKALLDYIRKNKNYIAVNRKYMAPYMVGVENGVRL